MTKQHNKPCKSCPFTRKSEPGATGGSSPEVYIAQTLMPYWVPCHCCIDYDNPDWKTQYETPQCVGHAMMRAKEGVAEKMPEPLLQVEPTEEAQVFDSLAQMFAYHVGIPEQTVQEFLTTDTISAICQYEMQKASANFKKSEDFKNQIQGDKQ